MSFDIEKLAQEFSTLLLNTKEDAVETIKHIVDSKREELRTKNIRLKIQKENFIKETVDNILNDINSTINYKIEGMKGIEISSEEDILSNFNTKISYRYEFFNSGSYKDDEFKEMIIAISKIILAVMMENGYMDEENKGVYVGVGVKGRNYIDVDFDLYTYGN